MTDGLDHSNRSANDASPPDEDAETARLRLEVERQRLELERDRLLLERQKLEQERKSSGRRPVTRPPSGERPAAPRPRAPKKASSAPVVASVLGLVAAAATVFGAVYLLGAPSRSQPVAEVRHGEPPELAALRAKATAGDGEAALHLGLFLHNGTSGYKRPDEAKEWLQRAAQAGDAKVAAQAVVALDWIRRADREERQREIQLAELEAERSRQAAERAHRAREAAERRRRDEAEALEREERRRRAQAESRRIALRQTLQEVREQLQEALPGTWRELVRTIERVENDPAADEEVQALAAGARNAAELVRESCAARGLSHARRLADRRQHEQALHVLDDVEALGHVLPEVALAERERWREAVRRAEEEAAAAAESEAAAAAAAAALADAGDESEEDAPDLAAAGDLAAIERAVHAKATRWLQGRTLRALRCYPCNGTQVVACAEGCAGGQRLLTTAGVTRRVLCSACNGTGRARCADSSCAGGLRTLTLRKVFWDTISPESRKARSWTPFLRELLDGQLGSLFGPAILVRSAEVVAVEVHDFHVEVTSRVAWERPRGWEAEARPGVWTSRWVRVKGQWFVATGVDGSPDRLR
ncbi:MAG: SEL1-like repeat protein [Planctomycetes bacterium]|nr:SEL1-like repeat protein [Planctomycetota bacterium]